MTRRRTARRRAGAVVGVGAVALASAAGGAGTAGANEWAPFPLPKPPNGLVSTPPGLPGDLSFVAPNRGLMPVLGNGSVPNGIYSWNGREWHQLATVCGPDDLAGARRSPVVWAGPREFWTVADTSPGVLVNGANALCHFQDGAVVGSYAKTNVPRYAHVLTAGACRAPGDCWFGGVAGTSEDGAQSGGFRLRWDGSALHPSYAPQGRPVSDMDVLGGRVVESVLLGDRPLLRDPEPLPALLHWNDGGVVSNDPWVPAPAPGVPDDGTELHALDGDGTTAWAVGGGRYGVQRGPVALRFAGGSWTEVPLHGGDVQPGEVFSDVAAVPGTQTAWATVNTTPIGASGQPRVAFIAADGAVTVHTLAGPSDPERGAAMHVACPAADDCWLATGRGYVYRFGGPKDYPVDEDPAFQGTITQRPNEGAAQFVPDTPPADDSRLHAPPVELPLEPEEAAPECRRPPRLMAGVSRPRRTLAPGASARAKNPPYRLTVRFRLARSARVALVAERRAPPGRSGGASAGRPRPRITRVVARTRVQTLRPGRRSLTVTVRRTSWPTRLRFVLRETRRPRCA